MRVTLTVDGMSCGHCKNAVEQAVHRMAGVRLAEVDLATKSLTVEFEPDIISLEAIKAAIEEEGYDVK